jgi:hypothetical protein
MWKKEKDTLGIEVSEQNIEFATMAAWCRSRGGGLRAAGILLSNAMPKYLSQKRAGKGERPNKEVRKK